MIYEFTNYRKYLKHLIVEKQAKNPMLSLNNVASQWGMAASTFSFVLSGQRNLSYEKALTLALKIGLKNKEVDYFCLLVKMASAKNSELKAALQRKLEMLNPKGPVHNFDADMFELISDWQHIACLDSMEMIGLQKTPRNLQKMLGLDKFEMERILDRLERLQLIRLKPNGEYEALKSNIFVNPQVPHKSLERYHKDLLAKASEAIVGQPFKERIFRTQNIVIDDSQLTEMDTLIEDFFAKAAELTKKSKKKNALYHLGTQFFRLLPTGVKK